MSQHKRGNDKCNTDESTRRSEQKRTRARRKHCRDRKRYAVDAENERTDAYCGAYAYISCRKREITGKKHRRICRNYDAYDRKALARKKSDEYRARKHENACGCLMPV